MAPRRPRHPARQPERAAAGRERFRRRDEIARAQAAAVARATRITLYQCDLIRGSAHLRTSVAKGIEIIEGLRGHTTGYAIPQFVIDAPGGGGKVPINPGYALYHDEEKIVIRNYEGKIFEYPEPGREKVGAALRDDAKCASGCRGK